MTTPKNIIGIVKELQGRRCECRLARPCIFCVLLTRHGRAIIQAALIGIEALQEIEIGSIKNSKWTTMDKTTCKEVVTEALSRIRALSLPQP